MDGTYTCIKYTSAVNDIRCTVTFYIYIHIFLIDCSFFQYCWTSGTFICRAQFANMRIFFKQDEIKQTDCDKQMTALWILNRILSGYSGYSSLSLSQQIMPEISLNWDMILVTSSVYRWRMSAVWMGGRSQSSHRALDCFSSHLSNI